MEQFEVMATLRTKVGKSAARKTRKGGVVPAVCYGKGSEPVHIEVPVNQVRKAISTPYKLNTVINLKITSKNGDTIEKKVLVKDVQKDVFGKEILHMDFIEVKEDQPVKIKVPVVLTGKAKGVAEGGILQQLIRELDIRCLPKDIPVAIEHDITDLKMGGAVHVKDLKLPENARVLVDKDRTVAVIVEVKEETAVPAAAAVAVEGAAPETAAAPAAGTTAQATQPAQAAQPQKPAQPEKK